MLSQGLLFVFCSTLLVLTVADDKADLINNATDLQSGIQSVLDEITSFENEKDADISQVKLDVKDTLNSAIKTATDAEKKLNGFKNDFCEKKLTDLSGFDYIKEIDNDLNDETKVYDNLVSPIKTQYVSFVSELKELIQNASKCPDGDTGCISTLKNTYDGLVKAADLTKNKPAVETEITNFIETIKNKALGVINNKETDTTSCFTKLADAKSKVDDFSAKVTAVITSANKTLDDYNEDSKNFTGRANTTLIKALSEVIDAVTAEVKTHQNEANNQKVDIKDCDADDLNGIFDQIKKEYVEMFNKENIKSYDDDVGSVLKAGSTAVNVHSTAGQELEDTLKQCDSTDCIDGMDKTSKSKFDEIYADINGTLDSIPKKISDYQSSITTTETILENTFSGYTGSKAKPVLDCIILKVNIAKIKAIQLSIFTAQTGIDDTINQLQLQVFNKTNSWKNNQQDVVGELITYVYAALANITTKENNAFKLSVKIDKCVKNKTDLPDVILPTATKDITTQINNHSLEVTGVSTQCADNLKQYSTSIQGQVEALRQCQETDTDCINDVQKGTNDKVTAIEQAKKDASSKLNIQITTSENAMEEDLKTIKAKAEADTTSIADAIMKCIQTEVDNNSALAFSPSILVLSIALFAQLYRYIM